MENNEPLESASASASAPATNSAAQAWLLPASILLGAIIVGGSIIYMVNSGKAPQSGTPGTGTTTTVATPTVSETADVVLGDANAPVSLIEYGDYQCPFCHDFFKETESVIRDQYIKTGKVKMVFRNFSFLGPESDTAAAAAECAKDQQHFWDYHDALYNAETKDGKENNGNITRAFLIKLAGDAKLDVPAFTSCVDSGKYATKIQQDMQDAQQYGVNSTPTVFINGQKFEGALPTAQFTAAIDAALVGK